MMFRETATLPCRIADTPVLHTRVFRHVLLVFAQCLVWIGSSVLHASTPRDWPLDNEFAPRPEIIAQDKLFALDSAMRDFLEREVIAEFGRGNRTRGLFEALQSNGQLGLVYDSMHTGSAVETFHSRQGNCLALVLLTAAFAKELGLQTIYNEVDVEPLVLLRDDVLYRSSHVNITIGHRRHTYRADHSKNDFLTIDFAVVDPKLRPRMRKLKESTVVSMFFNNRAAESVEAGELVSAYWWAREAVNRDPDFLPALNTLAVIYRRTGHPAAAEQVLRDVLSRDRKDIAAWTNLVAALTQQGKSEQAHAAQATLHRLRSNEPYHYFRIGERAFRERDYELARDSFAREARNHPNNHEFQFWLAASYLKLGQRGKAMRHLRLAAEASVSVQKRGIYSAKLDRLRALH